MIAWLIYNENDARENNSYIKWLIDEASKQGVDLQLLYRHELTIGIDQGKQMIFCRGKQMDPPSFVLIRTIEPLLQRFFEKMKIPVFNSYETASICNDKALTYMEINALHIPTVPTYFFDKRQQPDSLPLAFPFVLKQASGRGGKEVFFVQNKADYEAALASVKDHAIVIQDANVTLGRDLRVFIIGKEIIAAVLRKNDNDFRANFKLGGQAIFYPLSDDERKLIMTIVNHFDFGLVGIDFLIGKNGELLFNEIEDVVGSRILSETTEINLLEKYMTFILEKIKT